MVGRLSTAKGSHLLGKTAFKGRIKVITAFFVAEQHVEHVGVTFGFEGSGRHGTVGRVTSKFAMKETLRDAERIFVEFIKGKAEGDVKQGLGSLGEFLTLFGVERCQAWIGEGKGWLTCVA